MRAARSSRVRPACRRPGAAAPGRPAARPVAGRAPWRPRRSGVLQVTDDAALYVTLRLHRAEQAVERAERLLDHCTGDEGPPSPPAFDDPFRLQSAHRLPHGVAADTVLGP